MPSKKKTPNGATNQIADMLLSTHRQKSDRKIGIELERIGVWQDGTALHYVPQEKSAKDIRPGAEQLLNELHAKHPSWEGVKNDHQQLLGFKTPYGKVSLEPGSQLELSTDTRNDLHAIVKDVRAFEAEVNKITDPWGLKWIGLGVNPFHRPENLDVIPSTRYHIMTEYLGARGRLATSMMRLTSSIQINLDYSDEAEGMEMLRVALAAAPISYALFSNSPWRHGDKAGTLSYRNTIWRDTDPDRTGLLPEVFANGFDFRAYGQLVWTRPLMFAQTTENLYVNAQGKSLAQIAQGELPNVVADEQNQLNAVRELFTEARLKPGYVEVRSIDGQSIAYRYASVAFWVGILYSEPARKFVMETLGKLSVAERQQLWVDTAKDGLRASYNGRPGLKPLVTELLKHAEEGLKKRGAGEEAFLEPARRVLATGENPAEELLRQWNGPWQGDFSAVIEHVAKP